MLYFVYSMSVVVAWPTQIRFPAGLGIIISNKGHGCVSFVCVLSCVVSSGGPEILLITDFKEASPCISV